MQLTLSKDTLLRALSQVATVVERRHTLPILSNIKVDVEPQQLVLTGSDSEVELVARVALPAGAVQKAGSITLPARKLVEIVKSLPSEALVELQVSPEGKALIRSGSSRFSLGTLPAVDFPLLGSAESQAEITLAQSDLRRLLNRTAFAMAIQDVRFYLTGMLFEAEPNRLRTVSTDGHRLALAESDAAHDLTEPLQVIVPRKGVAELQRLLGDDQAIVLNFGRDRLRASLELPVEQSELPFRVDFTTRLIDGRFPDYKRVIPRHGDKQLLIDRDTLARTLQRVAILSNEKLRGIYLSLDGHTLQLRANNPEQDEAIETLAVDYQGAPLEISFNAQYLQDVLSALDHDTVQITLSEPNASALVTDPEDDDYRFVVMPMRV